MQIQMEDSNTITPSYQSMGDEWKPDSILTNEKFSEINHYMLRELFDGIGVSFSFEMQENNDEFNYQFTRHCRFPKDSRFDNYTIKLMIGEDFRPSPMAEALFYQKLKEYLGQDNWDEWGDSFIIDEIISNHWKLGSCWRKLRELKQEGIQIIEDVKSYFKEKSPDHNTPEYLSNYIKSQSINQRGSNHYYFDYSPLLLTFQTIFAELDDDDFDYNNFIKCFEDKLSKSLRDLLHNRKFDELKFSYGKRMASTVTLSEGKVWKLSADKFFGNYSMLIAEVIYLCLIKSNKLELLDPFEQLIRVGI